MKNLNKKIGAMFLAGMVAVGGVASVGIKAHANNDKFQQDERRISRQQRKDEPLKKEIENYIKSRKDMFDILPYFSSEFSSFNVDNLEDFKVKIAHKGKGCYLVHVGSLEILINKKI